MRLHELEENKKYIGEDGLEYKILDNHLCYRDGISALVATRLSTLTQNFTPKKDEPIVQWYSVTVWRKEMTAPIAYSSQYTSKDNFLGSTNTKETDYHWIKLTPACKTQGSRLVVVE